MRWKIERKGGGATGRWEVWRKKKKGGGLWKDDERQGEKKGKGRGAMRR
jgi:hypothetical protein